MIFIDHFLQLGNKETPYYGTNVEALIDDVAKAYQDVIADFYDHGCRYIQIDDTLWTYLIAEIPYQAFFVEYDDARSGSFEPWKAFKDKDAIFVAGLISIKNPELEDYDEIKKRYEEAKAIVGDQIALSPQCGFASVEEGNCIDEETQWKKIDLLVSCVDFLG